ncbi:MAG: hypothetical protein J5I47_10805 [Vicingus serpentipes]|nr:hypothetical protein [Vicingus serpentipes]
MIHLKNIFVVLSVIGVFALHPSLNKGETPITYFQYLVYGNSLDVVSSNTIDLELLEIKWVCAEKDVMCSDMIIFKEGKQVNGIPFEKGSQSLVVYYAGNKVGEISQDKIAKKQAHQYKVELLAKNNRLFFNGEIQGPSPYKGPLITISSVDLVSS